jgi:hypothetical protein
MTIQELFAMNKETLFGPQPQDTKTMIGYNAVIRQVGFLVDTAAKQLQEYGSLSRDIQTLVKLNWSFHSLDGIKAIANVDPAIKYIIELSNKRFCDYFEQVYKIIDLKVISPASMIDHHPYGKSHAA